MLAPMTTASGLPNMTVLYLYNATSLHHNATATSDTARMVLAYLFMGLLLVSVVIGNILVIMAVFTYRPLCNVQNFYIVSLSCCDLAVATIVMPFHIVNVIFGKWVLGKILCEIWLTSDILCCTASILNICVIALDRYRAIHDPLRYAQKRTLRNVLIMIFLIWFVSAIISVPPLFGWNTTGFLYDNETMVCHLTNDRSYVIYSASGSFYVPLFIMTFVYFKIFLATRARLRKRAMAAAKVPVSCARDKNGINTNTATTVVTQHSTNSDEVSDAGSDAQTEMLNNVRTCTPTPTPTPALTPAPTPTADRENILMNHASFGNNLAKTPNSTANVLTTKSELTKKRHNKDNRGDKHSRQKHGQVAVVKNQAVSKFLEERQKISLSKERKAARTLGVIMGTFILCWLPFFLMYVILPFCKSCPPPSSALENFIVWLGYVNSTLNPIIYTCFNNDFRKGMKRVVWKCFGQNTRRL